MGAKNYDYKKGFFKLLFILGVIFGSNSAVQAQDSTSTGFQLGRMELPNPVSIQDMYTYDPITDRYIYTQTIGDVRLTYPIILTPEEYQELILKEQMKAYFKSSIVLVVLVTISLTFTLPTATDAEGNETLAAPSAPSAYSGIDLRFEHLTSE